MKLRDNPYYQDILLFLVAFVVFASSLRNGFVGDDLIYFIGNKVLTSFDIRTIILSGALNVDYCPLRDISLALDYLLWGEDCFGFHLTNLVLYGFSVIMIRRLFTELQFLLAVHKEPGERLTNPVAPFIAAILFAVHPIHSEVVYAVNHRGVILAGLFFTLSCFMFLRYMRKDAWKNSLYAGSLLFFIASVLSKEYSIILPLVLVLFILTGASSERAKHLVRTIPFFFITGIFYFILKSIAVKATFITPASEGVFDYLIGRVEVVVQIIAYYLFRMLNADYLGIYLTDYLHMGSHMLLYVSLFVIAVVFYVTVALRRRFPQLMFGFIIYLICLIPVLNFFKTYPITADRFAYLPSLGIFFAITAVSFNYRPKLMIALTTAVAVFWSVIAMRQTVYWKDNIAFWEHIAEVAPSSNTYLHLGTAYLKNNNASKGREALHKARQYLPDSTSSVISGDILFMLDDYQGAIQVYENVLSQIRNSSDRHATANWQLYMNLANAYKNVGNFQKALSNLEKTVELKPDDASLNNSLGALCGEMKQYDRAIRAFEMAMSLDSGYGFAPLNLAKTYLAMGERGNAEKYLELVREKFPQLREAAAMLEKK